MDSSVVSSWQASSEPSHAISTRAAFDTTIEINTPENIAFTYRLAGPFLRLLAFTTDLMIRFGFFVLVLIVGGLFSTAVGWDFSPVLFLLWFALEWLYGAVFETFMNGQTPGKMIFGLRVLSVSGEPIDGLQAMLRNFLRLVDMFFLAGLLTCAMNGRFQRLGDVVCGTIVIVEERNWLRGVTLPDDVRTAALAKLLPASFVVSRSLARALAHYVNHRSRYSVARRKEICAHLARPFLARFNFPADTSYDLLLCALYYRTFYAEKQDEPPPVMSSSLSRPLPIQLETGSVYSSPRFER